MIAGYYIAASAAVAALAFGWDGLLAVAGLAVLLILVARMR